MKDRFNGLNISAMKPNNVNISVTIRLGKPTQRKKYEDSVRSKYPFTETNVALMSVRNVSNPHVHLIQRVGEGLLEVFYEDRNPFELMDHDGLLTEFYSCSTGFGPAYSYMQHCIAPIIHRYQNMDILEIGTSVKLNILLLLTTSRCWHRRSD